MQADVEAAVTEVMQQRSGAASSPDMSATQPAAMTSSPMEQPASAQPMTAGPATYTTTTVTAPDTASFTTSPAAASTVTPASFFATTASTPVDGAIAMEPKRSMTWLFILVGVILALGIAGGVVYAFFMGGSADLPIVTDQNAQSQQMQVLQQERDQLQGQVSSLTSNMTDLENQLGIFRPSTAASVPLTIRGTLSSSTTGTFMLKTSRDIMITVSNSKEAGVVSTLSPLVGAEVELTGTHAPASTLLKVTAINGTAVPAAAPVTASTTAQ